MTSVAATFKEIVCATEESVKDKAKGEKSAANKGKVNKRTVADRL